jgi:hypothetical protein
VRGASVRTRPPYRLGIPYVTPVLANTLRTDTLRRRVLTEICLCHGRSCLDIEDSTAPLGAARSAAADSPVGCAACRPDDYERFEPFFRCGVCRLPFAYAGPAPVQKLADSNGAPLMFGGGGVGRSCLRLTMARVFMRDKNL